MTFESEAVAVESIKVSEAKVLTVQLISEDASLATNVIRDVQGNVVARGYPKSLERDDPKRAASERARFLNFVAIANGDSGDRSAGPFKLELTTTNRALATNLVYDAKGNVVAHGHPKALQYAEPGMATAEQQRLVALVKAVNHDVRRMVSRCCRRCKTA